MDLGDLGPPTPRHGCQEGASKGGGKEWGGNKSSSRGRRWKGTRGQGQSLGKKEGSYLPPLKASLDAGRGESGLLMHEAAH